jgi:hypothetical protein
LDRESEEKGLKDRPEQGAWPIFEFRRNLEIQMASEAKHQEAQGRHLQPYPSRNNRATLTPPFWAQNRHHHPHPGKIKPIP